MKCPHCQHTTSEAALFKCSHCGRACERGPVEELEHIGYLQDWLSSHRDYLGEVEGGLQAEVQAQRRSLEDRLGLKQVDVGKASRELALLQAV